MGRVKLHKNLNSPRSKTREATEEVEKNSSDSENKERRKLPITVNIKYVSSTRKANKRNNYEDKSSYVKEKIGENQVDHEKIKSLLLKDK